MADLKQTHSQRALDAMEIAGLRIINGRLLTALRKCADQLEMAVEVHGYNEDGPENTAAQEARAVIAKAEGRRP